MAVHRRENERNIEFKVEFKTKPRAESNAEPEAEFRATSSAEHLPLVSLTLQRAPCEQQEGGQQRGCEDSQEHLSEREGRNGSGCKVEQGWISVEQLYGSGAHLVLIP